MSAAPQWQVLVLSVPQGGVLYLACAKTREEGLRLFWQAARKHGLPRRGRRHPKPCSVVFAQVGEEAPLLMLEIVPGSHLRARVNLETVDVPARVPSETPHALPAPERG